MILTVIEMGMDREVTGTDGMMDMIIGTIFLMIIGMVMLIIMMKVTNEDMCLSKGLPQL